MNSVQYISCIVDFALQGNKWDGRHRVLLIVSTHPVRCLSFRHPYVGNQTIRTQPETWEK